MDVKPQLGGLIVNVGVFLEEIVLTAPQNILVKHLLYFNMRFDQLIR